MSRTLSNSENASPLVRSHSEIDLDEHGAVVAPHARVEANRTSPAGLSRVKTFTSLSSLKTFDEQKPQLSERDSIFATTYFANDNEAAAATPRQKPTTDSKSHSFHNGAPALQLPPPLLSGGRSSSSVPPKADSSPTMTSWSTSTTRFQGTRSNKVAFGEKYQEGDALSMSHKDDHTHYSLSFDSANIKRQPSSISTSTQRPNSAFKPKTTTATTYHLRMSAPRRSSEEIMKNKNTANATDVGSPEAWNERSETQKDDITGDVHNHQENQQIEATLASEEPGPHGRSRKASHYLGIFKEKTGPQDRAGSKGKQQKSSKEGIDKPNAATQSLERQDEGSQLWRGPSRDDTQNVNNVQLDTLNDHVNGRVEVPLRPPDFDRSSTQSTPATPSLFSKQSTLSTDSEEDMPPYTGRSIEWRSEDQAPDSFPLRLLEEIRDHRRRRASRTSIQEPSKDHDGTIGMHDSPSSVETQGKAIQRVPPVKEDAHMDEEECESDKERISSATYYPHHAPSPDTVASHRHLSLAQKSKEELETSQLSPQTLELDIDESQVIHESTNSAFNLQSKDRIQYIETEFHRTPPLPKSGDERDHAGWSTTSSASDTDYESLDDPGRSDKESETETIDDGDVTPTATPNSYSFLRARQKQGRKPLRAVELQPYKHQVGGHTKVFSFSKQAICKQLNNRENVFYEVIERNHPQLLHFLPR